MWVRFIGRIAVPVAVRNSFRGLFATLSVEMSESGSLRQNASHIASAVGGVMRYVDSSYRHFFEYLHDISVYLLVQMFSLLVSLCHVACVSRCHGIIPPSFPHIYTLKNQLVQQHVGYMAARHDNEEGGSSIPDSHHARERREKRARPPSIHHLRSAFRPLRCTTPTPPSR